MFATSVPVGSRSRAVAAPQAAPQPFAVRIPTLPTPSGPSKSESAALRVLLCGTYPIGQSNGYSRVVYYIAKHLGARPDAVRLTVYGFQNYGQTLETDRTLPDTVVLHDALASEDPKRHGFGEKEIGLFLRNNPQDVVVIFNDAVITSALTKTIVDTLTHEERARFKLVSYMDQVYAYQKPAYIDLLNKHFDAVVAFTPYWAEVARSLGLREDLPIHVFPHGFDPEAYYPIPSRVARAMLGLPQDAFIALNLNRHQPRKRWDLVMIAFAELVARHVALPAASRPPRPLRMLIATSMTGYWELLDIFQHELRQRGVSLDVGKSYLLALARPQTMTDREINALYSACDVGMSCADGEGFGLCQFEHAAVGKPQVAVAVGGLRDFLNDGNSVLVPPVARVYVDAQRDGIGGLCELGDPIAIADGIWRYYMDPALARRHGKTARREILRDYPWDLLVGLFLKTLQRISSN